LRGYLERYAQRFDLMSCMRLNTRVLDVAPDPSAGGWVIRFSQDGAAPREERFAKVVIATGRHNKPMIPAVSGLRSFSGIGGVAHAYDYKQPERYRGQRVLVVGGSISALEISSDLVQLGAAQVITAYQRQRYVHQQLIAGMPADHVLINRYRALAEESFPYDVTSRGFRDFIVRTCGSPEQFGARQPSADIGEAIVTMSQTFLPLVAQGRIEIKPWLQAIDGRTVHFTDGSRQEVDAIIFGTGYGLNLPYLSGDLQRKLGLDATHIDLYKYTFHPDLPDLAFLGIVELIGTNFPPLELQARWISYVFSGARPSPSAEEMRAGVAACRARRRGPQWVPTQYATLLFARAAGVEPDLPQWPELARELLFGPLSAVSFRLSGRDRLPQAPQFVVEDARAFGVVPSAAFSQDECARLQALARARRDDAFAQYIARVTAVAAPGAVSSPAWSPADGQIPERCF
jgi:hypothetical protein